MQELIEKLRSMILPESSSYIIAYNDGLRVASQVAEAHQPQVTDEMVEKIAQSIHQCHYHPADWGSKEWRSMYENEKVLATAMAKAAIQAMGDAIDRNALESNTGTIATPSPAKPATREDANTGWMPIESAPKDGTIVLLWDGMFTRRGSFKIDYNHDYEPAQWFDEHGDSWSTGYYYCPVNPTHWMLLPNPPTNNESTE